MKPSERSVWVEKAKKILSPLFNPEPHPFQEEWSDAHSMSSETLVTKLAEDLQQADQIGYKRGLEEAAHMVELLRPPRLGLLTGDVATEAMFKFSEVATKAIRNRSQIL